MENKKKCHGGLKVLFLLLFGMLFAMSSTCYANMSSGYLDYIISTLHDNAINSSGVTQNDFNTYLNNLNNYTEEQKNTLLLNINNYLAQNNISNLNDYNIFACQYSSSFGFKLIISNNSSPNNVNNIDFYKFSNNMIKKYTNNTTDKIYILTVDTRTPSNFTSQIISDRSSYTFIDLSQNIMTFNSDGSVANCYNIATFGLPAGFQTVPLSSSNSSTTKPLILLDNNGGYVVPTPDPEPSGDSVLGDITNSSGDNNGNINLTPIKESLDNLQNQISGDTQKVIQNQNQNTNTIVNTISGEVGKITNTLTDNADDLIDNTKITSGDIANTVDFSIINNNENYNAYTNFWYNLTIGFSDSMTSVVRTLPVKFKNQTYLVNLDDFTVFIPNALKVFLGIISSVFVCIYITRESKHIVEDIQTASIDNVANKLTEDFETNMF